jgi:tetratricopeptide (TPR) repeat protein
MAHYQKALEIKPDLAEAHHNFGNALAARGRVDEAVAQWQKALAIRPDYPEAWTNLGNALAARRQLDEAVADYRKALEFRPGYADARRNLGLILYRQGHAAEALAQWHEGIRRTPDSAPLLCAAAFVLAAGREASDRNGAEAVDFAQRAMRLTGGRDPTVLDVMAAAWAETGQFPKAVETARQAMDLAAAQGNTELAAILRARIRLYEAGSPLRDTPN